MVRHRVALGLLTAALGLVFISGCSRFRQHVDRNDAKNASVLPVDDLLITQNIPYEAGGTRHTLDIYRLKTQSPPRPVLVFIYGGTWIEGEKSQYAWVGATLARQGYVTVVANYRVYPEGSWPGFIQDNAAAVRWVHDHAATYGGDSQALYLMGHSAGAFNVASLAVDHRWLAAQGLDPQRDIKGVIGLSGPYQFVPDTRQLRQMFGPKTQWADILPTGHVDGHSPPLLLIVGDKDEAAGTADTDFLAATVKAKGGEVILKHYPSMDHNGTLDAIAPPAGQSSLLLDDINLFVQAHSK